MMLVANFRMQLLEAVDLKYEICTTSVFFLEQKYMSIARALDQFAAVEKFVDGRREVASTYSQNNRKKA